MGIKAQTLYAYVSRGQVRARPAPIGSGMRRRQYSREDVDRLVQRRDARRGHTAVAASALSWGQPVLDSSVTEIQEEAGPAYRGHLATELSATGITFEQAAELLWTRTLPKVTPAWLSPTRAAAGRKALDRAEAWLRDTRHPLDALLLVTPMLALFDDRRFGRSEPTELEIARELIRFSVYALALRESEQRAEQALRQPTVSRSLLAAWGLAPTGPRVAAIDHALVLVADHELNVSTFAARVAASADADLYACIASGLGAVSGPRHGEACDRVEELIGLTRSPGRAPVVVRDRLRRGENFPGLGHQLYPKGDPRAASLLDLAESQRERPPGYRTLRALLDSIALVDPTPPSVDIGLVALTSVLQLPKRSASVLFAMGRFAGWVAHIREQRASQTVLRPRARYRADAATDGPAREPAQ